MTETTAALQRWLQLVVGLLVPLHRPGGQGHAWAGYADSLWSLVVASAAPVPSAVSDGRGLETLRSQGCHSSRSGATPERASVPE